MKTTVKIKSNTYDPSPASIVDFSDPLLDVLGVVDDCDIVMSSIWLYIFDNFRSYVVYTNLIKL